MFKGEAQVTHKDRQASCPVQEGEAQAHRVTKGGVHRLQCINITPRKYTELGKKFCFWQ